MHGHQKFCHERREQDAAHPAADSGGQDLCRALEKRNGAHHLARPPGGGSDSAEGAHNSCPGHDRHGSDCSSHHRFCDTRGGGHGPRPHRSGGDCQQGYGSDPASECSAAATCGAHGNYAGPDPLASCRSFSTQRRTTPARGSASSRGTSRTSASPWCSGSGSTCRSRHSADGASRQDPCRCRRGWSAPSSWHARSA